MGKGVLAFVALGVVCSVAVLVTTVGQTIAAPNKAKEPAPVVVAAKLAKQQSKQGESPTIQRAKKSPIPSVAEMPTGGYSEAGQVGAD